MLKPIRTDKIYKLIIDQLNNLIDEEHLKPGDRLPPEREIASSLSVSRSSVRHAIAALSAKGLIVVRQGEGTFIAEQKEKDLDSHSLFEEFCWNIAEQQISPIDISESRLLIECETARLCALRADDRTCAKLVNLLDRKRLTNDGKLSYEKLNYDLHIAIAEGSGNCVLYIIMKTILELMQSNMWPLAKNKSNNRNNILETHLNQHEELIAAIIAHDETLAVKIMTEHLSNIENEMSILFEYDEKKGESHE